MPFVKGNLPKGIEKQTFWWYNVISRGEQVFGKSPLKMKGKRIMLSRREYEEFFGKVSDEVWANLEKQMSDIQDRMWEEDHPLDD